MTHTCTESCWQKIIRYGGENGHDAFSARDAAERAPEAEIDQIVSEYYGLIH